MFRLFPFGDGDSAISSQYKLIHILIMYCNYSILTLRFNFSKDKDGVFSLTVLCVSWLPVPNHGLITREYFVFEISGVV